MAEEEMDVGQEDEAEKPEKTLDLGQEDEDKADFEKYKNKPTFKLEWDEDDIRTFGFVGMVYAGALESTLKYSINMTKWYLVDRPAERKELMNQMLDKKAEKAKEQAQAQEKQAMQEKLAFLEKQLLKQSDESKKTISSMQTEISNLKAQTKSAAEGVEKAEVPKAASKEESQNSETVKKKTLKLVRPSQGKQGQKFKVAAKDKDKFNAATAAARQKAASGKGA